MREFVARRADEETAAQEARLLQLLAARGLPVPAPRRLEGSTLVLDHVESDSPPAGLAQPLARALTRIHAAGIPLEHVSFLPDQGKRAEALLGRRPPVANEPALLHGDFWPGNCLWRNGEVAAIVDWEDAATGDPVADVANCRLELLWAAGGDALEEFTEPYPRMLPRVDLAGLAYWDLFAARRLGPAIGSWGLAPDTVSTMRERLDDFVAAARRENERMF